MKQTGSSRHLLKWIEKFHGVPLLVIGDLMVDRSLRGTVERISPEAPVPVIDVQEHTQTAGGAGNVACNLAALGAAPTLLAIRGADPIGEQITRDLERCGVNVESLFVDNDRPTITKTRVIAGHQQVVRLDVEKRGALSPSSLHQILSNIKRTLPHQKGIILSDYGKGVVTVPVIRTVLREAHRRNIGITVDPKIEHFLRYKGVDCITPNTKEAVEGMRSLPPRNEDDLIALGWKILKKLACRSLLITRGEKGMMLFKKGGAVQLIPTRAREVFDVTGAGDTVVAAFSLARAVGAPHVEAAQIANAAAGLVVAKLGTAVVTRDELTQALKNAS
jgi:D-beta-D-heptose 7-phosphate kinase/D-beta-D-heptose 1-phosphate adenosyltransferase